MAEQSVLATLFRDLSSSREMGVLMRAMIGVWGALAMSITQAQAAPAPAPASAVTSTVTSAALPVGDWQGALSVSGRSIPLVLHVTGGSEHWAATLDSPSQGASGLPVADVVREGAVIRFTIATPRAAYVATLAPDGMTLAGQWMQGGASLPLTMTRAVTAATPLRPQTPHPPYPYRSEEVGYDNASGHAHLAGTLTLPEGNGPYPAVLLITGSGLQDRDETVFGHKPFLLWADTLTRRGIAVLRVDDRQMGGSTGEVRAATTADFAGDVAAGVAFLRSRRDIDPHRIGLMGHSEGAIIAPMVAARDRGIAFVVMLAGAGVTGEVLMLEQKRLIETAMGMPPAAVEQSGQTMRRFYDAVKDAPDQGAADASLAGHGKPWRPGRASRPVRCPKSSRSLLLPGCDGSCAMILAPIWPGLPVLSWRLAAERTFRSSLTAIWPGSGRRFMPIAM
jgi:acetyl esterase/lipase